MKMTYFKSIIAISTGIILLVSTGCHKLEDFGDDNTNPLGSTQPITGALITNAESNLGELTTGTGTAGGVAIRAGLYCQYYSETQYPDASLYQEPKFDGGIIYSGILADCQTVINKNTDPATAAAAGISGPNNSQIGIATILKTYIAWTITDRWGDVPYSEALQGAGNFYPVYDKQEDIYKAFLSDLRDAVSKLDNGAVAIKGDIIYSGDVTKWKKFANTLSMGIAMRMTKRYPNAGDYAATQFALAAADANGMIESNSDNFTLNFPGGSYKNTWFNTFDGRSDYFFCKTMGDALSNLGDSRSSAFSSQNHPMPYGLETADANAFAGQTPYDTVLNVRFRRENSPLVIYSAANSLLTRAEAVERSWITGDAKADYEAGVTASFEQWGVTLPATYLTGNANYDNGAGAGSIGQNSYGSIPASSNGNTATKLDRIALQQWIAWYGNGVQGWSNWRRTGVPNLQPTIYAKNNPKEIPRRYVYGSTEYSLNPDQVKAAADRLSAGDVMSSRIWWDQ